MKLLILLFFLTSCSVVDHIEDSHDALWYRTKALKVIDRDKDTYLLESFSNPARTYIYKSREPFADTLILTDQVRACLVIKKLKDDN